MPAWLSCLLLWSVIASGCDTTDLAVPSPDLTPAATPADLATAPLLDFAVAGDLAYVPPAGAPFVCGNMSCGAGTVCCVTGSTPACTATCAAGSFVAQCRGPENCGGNPCCVNVSAGYKVHDVSCTTHTTDCPPMIDTTTGSGQERACHSDGDCTVGAPHTNLPSCCTNTGTGQHVCFNTLAVALVQGFTCP